MKKQFFFISTVLGLTLAMLAYNLTKFVSENNALEQKIRKHTYHISSINNVFRRIAHEQMHEMDPMSTWFIKAELMLHIIDSIEHMRFSPRALSDIRNQLESMIRTEPEEDYFTFLDDRVELTNRCRQFNYYKARIISECLEMHLDWIFRTPCMCLDRFEFVQLYEPGSNEYITHFGSFMRCDTKYHHVLVNGRVAPDGVFSFTPTQSGWNNLLIEVERYDKVRDEVVIDTFHYPIKVVESDPVPRT